MRLRNVKNALEIVNTSPYTITNPKEYKGNFKSIFTNNNPIHIEIGMGKGDFIIGMAKKYPNINFIGIEKYESVMVRAIQKLEDLELPNLKLINMDAKEINEVFSHEISVLYLNFSDPWPKTRHAKRRLTSETFLNQYKKVLTKDGVIEFKTDNRGLFEYSLESFNENNFSIYNISLDLHKDLEKYPNNITTEFEDKWSKLGPIYHLEAKRK